MEQQQQGMQGGRFDPELIYQLKKEVLRDLKNRREWQEKAYGEAGEEYEDYPGYPPRYAGGRGYGRRGPGYGYGMGPGRQYGWCPWPAPTAGYRRPPSFDDWWTDREEYDYQRNMIMLRKQLQRELQAINRINQRVAEVRDPQVRAMLQEILSDAWQKGMDIPDIMQSLSGNSMQPPNMQMAGGSLSNRLGGFFRGLDRRSFGWGAGAGLLGLLFIPSLTKALRPFVRKAMEEAMDVSERAQGVIARAKEEFEDIVAEASFNKIKDSLEEDVNGSKEKEPPVK